MEEIKVGEYVRTNWGITKLLKKEPLVDYPEQIIYTFDKLHEELWSGDLPNEMWQSEIDWETEEYGNPFIKHSFNIIDLIEVGDYVNGKRVFATENRINDNGEKVILTENYDEWTDDGVISNKDIKSIVIKEQFENIEYRLEEK